MPCLTKLCTSGSFFEASAVSELAVNSSAAKAVEPSHLWAIAQMIFRLECTTSVIEIYWYSVMWYLFLSTFLPCKTIFLYPPQATMARQCSMACGFTSYCRKTRLGQGEATRVSTRGVHTTGFANGGVSKVLLAGALWMKLQISPSLNQVPLM